MEEGGARGGGVGGEKEQVWAFEVSSFTGFGGRQALWLQLANQRRMGVRNGHVGVGAAPPPGAASSSGRRHHDEQTSQDANIDGVCLSRFGLGLITCR